MSSDDTEFSAVLVDDKRIILLGGREGYECLATTEMFDTQSDTFFPGPYLMMPRYGHSAVKINENQILILGGTWSLNNGEEEYFSCNSEFLDIRRLVYLYEDKE